MHARHYIAAHISKGNTKLPKTTWIFNAGSAKNCPSRRLGLCQCPTKCCARKAEKAYPPVLPYRVRQEKLWTECTPAQFANALLETSRIATKVKLKTFRYNESGDFENQSQVAWFAKVCQILTSHGITCYGHTARTDLDLTLLNGTSCMQVSNNSYAEIWRLRGANVFKTVKEYSKYCTKRCDMDCKTCQLCQFSTRQTIEVKLH